MDARLQRFLNTALLIGCIYEVIALLSHAVPTITKLLRLLGSKPFGKVLVWAWCGFVSYHFMVDE